MSAQPERPTAEELAVFMADLEKLSEYEGSMRASRGWGAFPSDYKAPPGNIKAWNWLKAGAP